MAAITLNNRKVVDGPRNTIQQVFLSGNGTNAELTNQVIYDHSAASGSADDAKVMSIRGSAKTCDIFFKWDATADVEFFHIPAGEQVEVDFSKFGGLSNNSTAGKTGDVMIATVGLTSANAEATFEICLKKKEATNR